MSKNFSGKFPDGTPTTSAKAYLGAWEQLRLQRVAFDHYRPQHSCYCEVPTDTGSSGFDLAYLTTTRNGIDMLIAAMTLLQERGLEAPDATLWKELMHGLRDVTRNGETS